MTLAVFLEYLRPMQIERRRSPRTAVDYPAFIDAGDGSPMLHGIVWDISDRGAKLIVSSLTDLPDTFKMLLVSEPSVRYECQVVWRSAGQIGIEFLPR
jgi:PilZ domain